MQRIVRNAAKALIIKDDKMLAVKISDDKEEWYIMPGGGQAVEELLPQTVCREVAEEVGIQVEVKDLAFVCCNKSKQLESSPLTINNPSSGSNFTYFTKAFFIFSKVLK